MMMLNKQGCSRIAHYFRTNRFARIVCAHVVVMSIVALVLMNIFGPALSRTSAASSCSAGDTSYTVVAGDTLGAIAQRYGTTWQELADYNKLADANLIFADQEICIPDTTQESQDMTSDQTGQEVALASATGSYNPYPYGQCTWWADERYHQLHKAYVPWLSNSDAWKWTDRARQYGWKVSSKPSKGAILVLQPWVQGASGVGHVAVVEKVLSNDRVLTSNMNWGGSGAGVVNVEFRTGKGVSFVTR